MNPSGGMLTLSATGCLRARHPRLAFFLLVQQLALAARVAGIGILAVTSLRSAEMVSRAGLLYAVGDALDLVGEDRD